RFLWNATALITNGTIRAAGGLLLLLARGIGWRRLARLATTTMGVGLSYSGGIFLSERQLRRGERGARPPSAPPLPTPQPLAWPAPRMEDRHCRPAGCKSGLPALPLHPVPHCLSGAGRAAHLGAGCRHRPGQLVLEGLWPHASRRHRPSAHDARRA